MNEKKQFQIADAPINVEKTELVSENKYVKVYMDIVRFYDSSKGSHLRVEEPGGGTVVIVINQEQKLYIHEVFHYSANAYLLEFIRGYGEPDEIAQKTALRELEEEGNFEYKLLEEPLLIGNIYPNSTILMSRIPVYFVRVELMSKKTYTNNNLEMPRAGQWITVTELENFIEGGKIEDGFTLSAFALAKTRHLI